MGCGCGGSSIRPLTSAEIEVAKAERQARIAAGERVAGGRNPMREPGYTWNGPQPKQ